MVSVMDLARAPRRAPLTARKKGSGYENENATDRNLDPRLIAIYCCRSERARQQTNFIQLGKISIFAMPASHCSSNSN